MDLYYKSVGRNGVFLMNVPPSDKGVIATEEVAIIEEFTRMRESIFGVNLADGATAEAKAIRGGSKEKYCPDNMLDGNFDTFFATDDDVKETEIVFTLDGEKTFNRVQLQEYIPLGQRVKDFDILVKVGNSWEPWGEGETTTIGYKRIVLGDTVSTDAVKVVIKDSKACPVLNGFALYYDSVSGL